MPANPFKPKKLFTKYGKELKSYTIYEAVNSIWSVDNEDIQTTRDAVITIGFNSDSSDLFDPSSRKGKMHQAAESIYRDLKEELIIIRRSKIRLVPVLGFFINIIFAFFIFGLLSPGLSVRKDTSSNKYSIFSGKPLVLGASSIRLAGDDSRAVVLDKIFESYNCPLTGLGARFVFEADKNNIPFWLVPSISFQESSCGKKVPELDGGPTYNAWGWGVWGDNTYAFKSWEEGIKVVSEYMGTKFYSRGVTDLCEIMKVYTPPSDGSWCRGVGYFANIITNYKTSQ